MKKVLFYSLLFSIFFIGCSGGNNITDLDSTVDSDFTGNDDVVVVDEEVDEDDENEDVAEEEPSEPQYLDVEIDMDGEDSFNESKQNFLYLLDLIAHPENERNKEELQRVKHLFLNRDFF